LQNEKSVKFPAINLHPEFSNSCFLKSLLELAIICFSGKFSAKYFTVLPPKKPAAPVINIF